MKKYNLLLLAFSFCVLTATAQIPNFSFENWTNKGSYEIPVQWGTLNNSTANDNVFTVTKASPGSPGSFYMKITSRTIGAAVVGGIAVCGELDSISKKAKSGFAYSAQPASFTGKWQHMIFGTSQGSVKAILTKWNNALNKRDTIGIASKTLTGMAMSWANFTVNFVYFNSDMPDSCIIELRSSGSAPTDQDYLWVDNLGFTGVATGIDVLNTDNDAIEVYPNPTTSVVNIRSKNSSRVENVILFDILGNKLLELNEIPENGIDISKFTKGNYFVQIKTKTALTIKKISLQ